MTNLVGYPGCSFGETAKGWACITCDEIMKGDNLAQEFMHHSGRHINKNGTVRRVPRKEA